MTKDHTYPEERKLQHIKRAVELHELFKQAEKRNVFINGKPVEVFTRRGPQHKNEGREP